MDSGGVGWRCGDVAVPFTTSIRRTTCYRYYHLSCYTTKIAQERGLLFIITLS